MLSELPKINFALTSVEMFDGTTENLINFAFNVGYASFLPVMALKQILQSASYDMNDSMYVTLILQ